MSSCHSKLNQFAEKAGQKASQLFDILFKCIYTCRWIIVIFWILFAMGMAYCLIQFLTNTSLVVNAPEGSLGHEANEIFKQNFPDIAGDTAIATPSRAATRSSSSPGDETARMSY